MIGKKIVEWLRTLTLGVLIVLCYLHFKSVLLRAMTIDVTKISLTQIISYEWIVPIISIMTLLSRRQAIARAADMPSWAGFFCTCVSLAALSVSAHANQSPFQLLSIAAVICSVTYAFWGREAASLLFFPAWFLIFAVPITFYLALAEKISVLLSDSITHLGTAVELSGFSFCCEVFGIYTLKLKPETPSSGIRSLFALAAITSAFAHFTVKSRTQRLCLYAAAIPITVLVNFVRSFLICFIAFKLGHNWAVAFYNNFSQYICFFVGLLLIFQAANFIVRIAERFKKPDATEWLQSMQAKDNINNLVGAPKQSAAKSASIVLLVLVVALLAFLFASPSQPTDVKGPAPAAKTTP